MLRFSRGTTRAPAGDMTGVRRFTDLRAWRAAYEYKNAVYKLFEEDSSARGFKRRDQLEDSVAGPPGHIAEGYGRFNPADFARFLVIARSSLMESQNHLLDAVDTGHLTEERRRELNALAEAALQEVTGLMEYLQSPEALRNARRARERRIASRPERRHVPGSNPEQGTQNGERATQNPELRTQNPERRTKKAEPSTRKRT